MYHQFLSLWQYTFVAGYPIGVLVMAFQIGGLLAFGLTKYLATRTLVYRDEIIMIPVWTVGISVVMLIYRETSMWPGLLVLLEVGAVLFAYWSFRRLKRLNES